MATGGPTALDEVLGSIRGRTKLGNEIVSVLGVTG